MKKILLLFICVFLITGCDVNYSVTINEDETFDEKITMSFVKTTSDGNNLKIAEDNKTPISVSPNENKFYNSEIIDKGNTYDMVYSYKHDINSVKQAYFIANCYPKLNITNSDEEIMINTGNGFACFIGDDGLRADSMTINLTTELKVLDNNADKINGNTYTWIVNENNYLDKSVYFRLQKKPNLDVDKNNASYLMAIVVLSIVIVGFLIYLFVRYKKNRNNNF